MNLHSVLKHMLHGVLLACALCANSITAAAEPPASVPARIEAEHAIRHLLMQTFDRPEERLAVEPVFLRPKPPHWPRLWPSPKEGCQPSGLRGCRPSRAW